MGVEIEMQNVEIELQNLYINRIDSTVGLIKKIISSTNNSPLKGLDKLNYHLAFQVFLIDIRNLKS